jgi:hypothetical protein
LQIYKNIATISKQFTKETNRNNLQKLLKCKLKILQLKILQLKILQVENIASRKYCKLMKLQVDEIESCLKVKLMKTKIGEIQVVKMASGQNYSRLNGKLKRKSL